MSPNLEQKLSQKEIEDLIRLDQESSNKRKKMQVIFSDEESNSDEDDNDEVEDEEEEEDMEEETESEDEEEQSDENEEEQKESNPQQKTKNREPVEEKKSQTLIISKKPAYMEIKQLNLEQLKDLSEIPIEVKSELVDEEEQSASIEKRALCKRGFDNGDEEERAAVTIKLNEDPFFLDSTGNEIYNPKIEEDNYRLEFFPSFRNTQNRENKSSDLLPIFIPQMFTLLLKVLFVVEFYLFFYNIYQIVKYA